MHELSLDQNEMQWFLLMSFSGVDTRGNGEKFHTTDVGVGVSRPDTQHFFDQRKCFNWFTGFVLHGLLCLFYTESSVALEIQELFPGVENIFKLTRLIQFLIETSATRNYV